MKGAVNINTSPPTGHGHKTYRGSLPPFETSGFNPLFGNSVPHHYVASSSETEKRSGGQWSPTTVLFESQWTTAFPGRARGDRVFLGLSAKAVRHRLIRILTLDLIRSEHTDDESVEFIVLPANRSKRLCRRIQLLRIERFSFLPNYQRNGGNLARQRQPRHLSAHPPLLETLNVTAVRFASATGNGRADEQLL